MSQPTGTVRPRSKKYQVPYEFIDYYTNHNLEECAIKFNTTWWMIWQWAKKCGLRKVRTRGRELPQTLTERQNNILIGSMLGDGCLAKRYKNANSLFCLKHCEAQKEYLDWMHNELSPYSNKIRKEKAISRTKIDGHVINPTDSFAFETVRIPLFSNIEKQWYLRDGNGNYIFNALGRRIKKVPQLKLNPLIVAVWFYDDGSNNQNRRTASFSSQSFTQQEQQFLVDELKTLNITAAVVPYKHQHVIVTRAKSYVNFIDMISNEIPCNSMKYKISLENYIQPNGNGRFKEGFDKRRTGRRKNGK